MMKRLIKITLIFLGIYLFGQTSELPKIIPPSPTAAGLGKYGEYPVNNYTGVPSINIPLYTVKSGEIELPISLSYHASGVKVAEEASWVGLGWSLNAGGCITRQVVKKDDFNINGYAVSNLDQIYGLNNPNMAITAGQIGQTTYNQLAGTSGITQLDIEPDIYNFNFMGYTGKLLIKKAENNIVHAFSTESSQLDFIYHLDTKQWEVTDIKGWKYYFGTSEISRTDSFVESGSTVSPPASDWAETAWYIDQVITPKGDKLDFEYLKDSGWSINFNGISEERTYDINISNKLIANAISTLGPPTITKNYNNSEEVYIKKINFNGGYLDFVGDNSRKDRKVSWNSDFNLVLNNLSIYDKNNSKIETIFLNTDYFNQDKVNDSNKENYLRLKLNEIVFNYGNNNPQSYKFQYSDITLPPKDSYSQDYWGYYNGADNQYIQTYKYIDNSLVNNIFTNEPYTFACLVPFYTKSTNYDNILYIGANRNSNENFIQAGLLQKIIYPTGGKTLFEFETNQYKEAYTSKIIPKIYTVSSKTTDEIAFTVSKPIFALLEFSYKNNGYYSNPNDYTSSFNMTMSLEKDDGTKIIKFMPSDDLDNIYGNYSTPNTTRAFVSYKLLPGNYKMKAKNAGNIYLDLNVTAKLLNEEMVSSNQGGGIRIKSIKNIDAINQIEQKQFSYTDDAGNCSGKLLSKTFNFYNESELVKYYQSLGGGNDNGDAEQTFINSLLKGSFIIISGYAVDPSTNDTAPFPPLYKQFIKGVSNNLNSNSVIGYSQVSISNIDPYPFSNTPNLGKNIFIYKNEPNFQLGHFLPFMKEYEHDDNGQLISEKKFDLSSKLLYEKKNFYTKGYSYGYTGFRVIPNSSDYCLGVPSTSPDLFNNCHDVKNTFFNRFYTQDLSWWYPSQTIEKSYPSGGGTPLITTKNYTYNNLTHKQLTQEETILPEGITLRKTYKYADEVGNQLMKDKNMIGIPLVSETQKIDNGVAKTLSKVETQYPMTNSELGSGLMLPNWTKTYGLDNLTTPNTFITYDKYDSKGNILQYSEKGLKPTTFIWGYTQTLPIAKIEGITYSDLATKLSFSNTADGYTTLPFVAASDLDKDQTTENDLITALDNFRKDSQLSNYQITTFTYNPIIGVTSITPPSGIRENYIYDNSNRLQQIKDVNGNILKEYNYNYSNGIADDGSIANISGPENVNIFNNTSNNTITATYTFSTKNMPSDLMYYWSITPESLGATSSGASYPMPNNSATININFTHSGRYILNLYVLKSTTGESFTISKTINVNLLLSPSSGNTFSPLSSIQLNTSYININNGTVSGYMVFTPINITGTTDIALIPMDKMPSTDRTFIYHQNTTNIDRTWTFIFKESGVLTVNFTGTPLANGETINIPSFTYQK